MLSSLPMCTKITIYGLVKKFVKPLFIFWIIFLLDLELNLAVAGVVRCGGRKTSPRTSAMVQFIFHFWSFEISERILINQKLNWFRLIFLTVED